MCQAKTAAVQFAKLVMVQNDKLHNLDSSSAGLTHTQYCIASVADWQWMQLVRLETLRVVGCCGFQGLRVEGDWASPALLTHVTALCPAY